MILESIALENFGVYADRQEADLTTEPGKPIILFGGLNGGGKTTLLDAIQLAFYGPKARISNRGRQGYKDYLRDSIHRAADPGEGAAITLRFQLRIEGEAHAFELRRSSRVGIKGIEETLRVLSDGQLDEVFTEHWDEVIEGYLPSDISHLFFFDGEQIKALAEGAHAAEILGTAVHSLLGLDLVDRLEADLKVFERRKKAEGLDDEGAKRLAQVQGELEATDREQERVAMEEGARVNEAGRLAKELRAREEEFRNEGGALYERRSEIEAEAADLTKRRAATAGELRELAAGPLPLLIIDELLGEVAQIATHEAEIRRALLLRDALTERDAKLLGALTQQGLDGQIMTRIGRLLDEDRRGYAGLSEEPLILDAEESLPAHIHHLRTSLLPDAQQQAERLVRKLTQSDERVVRLEGEMERIPTADRIAPIIKGLERARAAHEAMLKELEGMRVRKEALQRQRQAVEARLDRAGEQELEGRIDDDDDRQRMLKHSAKVRDTLARFRTKVVCRHAAHIETLMLESFRSLLRKKSLVSGLRIDPDSFRAVLTGQDGKNLPFDRLSAGERQLLATSIP